MREAKYFAVYDREVGRMTVVRGHDSDELRADMERRHVRGTLETARPATEAEIRHYEETRAIFG